MNITIFETYTDVVHGNSKNIYLLGQGISKKKHTVNYLLSNHGKLSEFLDNQNLSVEIIKYPSNLGFFGKKVLKQNPFKLIISLFRYNYKIYKKIKYIKPDIIHCTSTRSIISCGFASRFYGAKLVWVIQMEHSNLLLDILAALLSNHIIFIAKSLMENKPKILQSFMKSKSQVIPIGIELDKGSQKVKYNDICQSGLNVLCVASLVPDKGIHLLVDGISDLLYKGYDIKCTFVGQEVPQHEEYVKNIKRAISESNLSSRIIFHGWTEDVTSFLLQSDIFVLPSVSEGLSRAILEAMFVGIPVIAFDTGALSEIVDNNVGRLMKKDSNQTISKALEFYLNDGNLIRIHGQEARKRVENQYTLRRYLENMDEFYTSCLRNN